MFSPFVLSYSCFRVIVQLVVLAQQAAQKSQERGVSASCLYDMCAAKSGNVILCSYDMYALWLLDYHQPQSKDIIILVT